MIKQYFDFKGKVAVVTGGRRGLGRAMALALADAGADIAVVSKSESDDGLLEQIEAKGVTGLYIPADLSDRRERDNLIERVVNSLGRIDILINSAGVQQYSEAIEYSSEMWDYDMELMLTAVMELSQQAAKFMIQQGQGGKIIQMASISSFQGARNIIGYSTVKHAIVGLTKCLANELAGKNINVNAIAPGLFKTDMAKDFFADKEKVEIFKTRIPDGRFGEAEDIIGPMLFLASDMSRHVHGHILLVDGGWMGR